jgi:hypothetical protein
MRVSARHNVRLEKNTGWGHFSGSNFIFKGSKFVSNAKLQPNFKPQLKIRLTFQRYKLDEKAQQTTCTESMPRNRWAASEFVCGTTKWPKLLPVYSKKRKNIKNTKMVSNNKNLSEEHQ